MYMLTLDVFMGECNPGFENFDFDYRFATIKVVSKEPLLKADNSPVVENIINNIFKGECEYTVTEKEISVPELKAVQEIERVMVEEWGGSHTRSLMEVKRHHDALAISIDINPHFLEAV